MPTLSSPCQIFVNKMVFLLTVRLNYHKKYYNCIIGNNVVLILYGLNKTQSEITRESKSMTRTDNAEVKCRMKMKKKRKFKFKLLEEHR